MIKLVTLFLIVVVTLAMFGKLGWLGKLGGGGRVGKRPPGPGKPAVCIRCGRHVIGTEPCDCDKV